MADRKRVLVICADKLGSVLAGPAMRAYEIARVLQEHADVTLAGDRADTPPPGGVPTVLYSLRSPGELRPHVEAADVVFAQPQWPVIARWLRESPARLIFDLATPEPFEVLEGTASRPLARRVKGMLTLDRVLGALGDGHHFVCAGDKQRDLWLGAMLNERLISPALYDSDPSLLSVIDSVPFGAPAEPPRARGAGPEEHFDAVGPDDEVVLWNGGIWGWLDAPAAIHAVAEVARERPRLRLVFMGASSAGPARTATEDARRAAGRLGLLGTTVLFNEAWVPYERRADWLLRSSCAISAHRDNLETRFAYRTRMLDCFWAGLPVVCTEGDELAGRVEREDLGATAPPGDVAALAAGIRSVLDRGRAAYAGALARAAADHAWPRVAEPLVRYVTETAEPPLPRRPRRPAHAARDGGFRVALAGLNAAGVRRTPFL